MNIFNSNRNLIDKKIKEKFFDLLQEDLAKHQDQFESLIKNKISIIKREAEIELKRNELAKIKEDKRYSDESIKELENKINELTESVKLLKDQNVTMEKEIQENSRQRRKFIFCKHCSCSIKN